MEFGAIAQFRLSSGQGIELSFHRPSPFVAQNLNAILPDCPSSDVWVVLLLQQSCFPLDLTTPQIEVEKNLLRDRFIKFSNEAVSILQKAGFFSDYIDPKTGYPGLSRRGIVSHDDTAVVAALRGFPRTENDCFALYHPVWHTNIYPGVLMTTAKLAIAQSLLIELALKQGWTLTTG
ncbi:MAG: methylmalonic aciduria and homocystinuria type D protein [Spirulinaceae cyanobacterium]